MLNVVRAAVADLALLGCLPPEKGAVPDNIKKYEYLLRSIERPVTDAEAAILIRLFGADDCFGLASHLMHLIESAPNWPLVDLLQDDNIWVRRMRDRISTGSGGLYQVTVR